MKRKRRLVPRHTGGPLVVRGARGDVGLGGVTSGGATIREPGRFYLERFARRRLAEQACPFFV